MEGLKFTFERGGVIYACLFDSAVDTKKSIFDILPLQTNASHTRWCGREVYANIKTKIKPSKENQTTFANKFDVTYWRDWDIDNEKNSQQSETISIFYGSELLRIREGLLQVNVIGRVDMRQESRLEEICLRVWQRGFEKVIIEKHIFED